MVMLVIQCLISALTKMLSCAMHGGVSSTDNLLQAQRATSLFALSLSSDLYSLKEFMDVFNFLVRADQMVHLDF